jgi:methylmalonyl-CoA/ethylmalonyl-CoA epimerase
VSIIGLAYVALAVRDVEAAADVLEHRLELVRREARTPRDGPVPVFGIGASALALFATDDPFLGKAATPGVHHIAIAAENPARLIEDLHIAKRDTLTGPGLDGVNEIRLETAATCGVRTRFCQRLEPMSGSGDIIERIDHVGVASADNGAVMDFFSSTLGLKVESTQTDLEVHTATESFTSDRYGVVYHNRPPRIVGGLRVTFITIGDSELEFLEPLAPGADTDPQHSSGPGPGNTGSDKNAIGRYLDRHGPGLHHLALKTADIDATLARLSQHGLSLIDTQGRPGSRRARIGFIHPRALSGLLVHLVERDAV